MTWKERHQQLVDTAKKYKNLRYDFARLLCAFHRSHDYLRLGCASLREYGEKHLELTDREVSELRRIGEAMESMEPVRQAVEQEDIPWTKVREIVRVATQDTAEAWVAKAKTSSSRNIEQLVSQAKKGERPEDVPSDRPAKVPFQFQVSPKTQAIFEGLFDSLRKNLDHWVSDTEALELLAEQLASGGISEGEAPKHTAQLFLHRCTECRKTMVETEKGMQPVEECEAADILCNAKLRFLDEPERRLDAGFSQKVKDLIFARDGHQCQFPGCHARHFLEAHHLVERAQGGKNTQENGVTLCWRHHRMAHAGLIEIESDGKRPIALRVRPGKPHVGLSPRIPQVISPQPALPLLS